jgi:hypothetical protein
MAQPRLVATVRRERQELIRLFDQALREFARANVGAPRVN